MAKILELKYSLSAKEKNGESYEKEAAKYFVIGIIEANTLPEKKTGDVDGDGAINVKDATMLRRYLAGGWGVELNKSVQDIEKVVEDSAYRERLYKKYGLKPTL